MTTFPSSTTYAIAPLPPAISGSGQGIRFAGTSGGCGCNGPHFGACNPVSKLAPKATQGWQGLWQPLKQLMNDPHDGNVIKGFVYKYALPAAVTAGNLSIPGGVLLFPFVGLPLSIWLSKKGSNILKSSLDAGIENAKRTPFHRLSDVMETILDPEHNRDAKTVVNTYNDAMDGVFDHVKRNTANTTAVSDSQLDRLKRVFQVKEGSVQRTFLEKFIGARKHYKTSMLGRFMLKLGRLGRRFSLLKPVALVANLAFVALKWKKI